MSHRVLFGPSGQPLPPGLGPAIAALAASPAMASARGVDVGVTPGSQREQDLAGWRPAQTSADGLLSWNREEQVSRIYDLLATEPWAQGAVDRKLDMVIGAGWRPSIKPDAAALGITDEAAASYGKLFESIYRNWGEDPLCRCDAEETLSASWLLHLMVMGQEVTGDGLGVLRWNPRGDWAFRTALQVVDSDRLSNPQDAMDTDVLRGGVEKDASGLVPVAYHIRDAHPADLYAGSSHKAYKWSRVERRTEWGRPQVLHLFEKRRAGQSRGISRLVAGLARFKQMARFSEAELANAVINALTAATITSSFDPALAAQHLTSEATAGFHDLREQFYGAFKPMLGGVGLQHLFPGDELKFLTSPRQTAAFESFFTVFLRSIASSLGIAYEQIAMDWSKVNYSSARAALVEVWRGIMKARSMVAMMVAQPLLLAVIEDAIDLGMVELPPTAPNLYEAPAAWLRGRWLGPARGWVDPVKEPQGALMRIEAGLSNWDDESAEQGMDFDQTLLALKANRKAWEDAGLTPPALAAMLAVQPRSDGEDPVAA